jgi:hypothetical protein
MAWVASGLMEGVAKWLNGMGSKMWSNINICPAVAAILDFRSA